MTPPCVEPKPTASGPLASLGQAATLLRTDEDLEATDYLLSPLPTGITSALAPLETAAVTYLISRLTPASRGSVCLTPASRGSVCLSSADPTTINHGSHELP